jgi:hypothetical protein
LENLLCWCGVENLPKPSKGYYTFRNKKANDFITSFLLLGTCGVLRGKTCAHGGGHCEGGIIGRSCGSCGWFRRITKKLLQQTDSTI